MRGAQERKLGEAGAENHEWKILTLTGRLCWGIILWQKIENFV